MDFTECLLDWDMIQEMKSSLRACRMFNIADAITEHELLKLFGT